MRNLFQLTFLCLLSFLWSSTITFAQNGSYLDHLPESTVLVANIPNGTLFYERSIQGTKFGRTIFSKKRWTDIQTLMKGQNPEGWQQFTAALSQYGFSLEGLPQLMAGETGIALSLHPRESAKPLAVVWFYLTPAKAQAEKLWQGIPKAMAALPEKHRPKMSKLSASGKEVLSFTFDVMGTPPEADLPANFDEMTPDQIQEYFRKKRASEKGQAAETKIDLSHFIFAKDGQRILMAMVAPQHQSQIQTLKEAEEVFDWNQLTGKTVVQKALEGVLSGKKSNLKEKFAMKDLDTKGEVLIEMFGHLKPLLELVYAEDSKIEPVVTELGLGRLDRVGFKATDDGKHFKSAILLESQKPHQGLLKALEDSQGPLAKMDWVPATAATAGFVEADLGAIWQVIRQAMIKTDPNAQMSIGMAELQLQTNLGVNIQGMLQSLGKKHMLVQFPFEAPKALPGVPMGQVELMALQQKQAFVWKLKDNKPWQKLVMLIDGMGMVPFEKVSLHGFTGYVPPKNGMLPIDFGIFLGHGHLVFCIGKGVDQQVLPALKQNPVKGLFQDPQYVKLKKLMPIQKGLMLTYSDMARSGQDEMFTQIGTIFDQLAQMDGGQADMVEAIKKILPTKAEMKGTLGQNLDVMYMTSNGLMIKSVASMPR